MGRHNGKVRAERFTDLAFNEYKAKMGRFCPRFMEDHGKRLHEGQWAWTTDGGKQRWKITESARLPMESNGSRVYVPICRSIEESN